MTVRLLIADDHAVVREGLHLVMGLHQVLKEEACTGLQAVDLAQRARPDVILMDLLMPDKGGTTATQVRRRGKPHRPPSHSAFAPSDVTA